MACKEVLHLLRVGAGDQLTDEELDALFDWHAHKCTTCLGRYRAMTKVPVGTVDARRVVRQRMDAWHKSRSALLRSARAKLS